MSSQDVFEPLDAADGSSFEELCRIYEESIPSRERKPRAAIAALVNRPDYEILLARRSGRVIGFSVLFRPLQEPFGLLEYMAVQENCRNGNVGATLFQRTLARREALLLIEVDSDRIVAPDQEIRQRRQRFYRRLGCLQVEGLPYILPWPAEGPPPEMDLMIHLPPDAGRIPKSRLESWLKIVYQEVYGCSPDDLRIVRMMESVADPVGLV